MVYLDSTNIWLFIALVVFYLWMIYEVLTAEEDDFEE